MTQSSDTLRLLSLQFEISRMVDDPLRSADAILEAICRGTDWEIGEFWRGGDGLYQRLNLYVRREAEEALAPFTIGQTTLGNESLVGLAAEAMEPTAHPDLAAVPRVDRYDAALAVGLQSALVLPIVARGRMLGVMLFLHRARRLVDGEELEFFRSLSNYIGLAIIRTETENALRRSEERLRRSHAAARVGTWDYDVVTGKVVWDGVETIHGMQPGTFEGTFDAYLADIHPDDRASVRAAIQESAETGSELSTEYRILLPDGGIRWVHGRGMPFVDSMGKTVYMAGTCQDVTEQVRYRKALELLSDAGGLLSEPLDPQALLIQIADLSVEAFAEACMILAPDGETLRRIHIATNNAALQAVLEELNQRFPPRLGPGTRLNQLIEKGQPILFQNVSAERTRDGEPEREKLLDQLELDSLIFVPLKSRGELVSVLAFMRTRHTRAFDQREFSVAVELGARASHAVEAGFLYEELRQANREKDEFLGILSHELRTPITTIYGGARLLRSRGSSLSQSDLEDLISDIESESERLYRLIENLLVLARLQLGVEVLKQPVVVHSLIQRLMTTFARRRPHREVKINIDERADVVSAEPTYLDQTLYNLLSNADKYSPSDQPIEIDVHVEDDAACFRVLDRGPGIPDDEMDRVFESFYRSRSNPKGTPGKGVGLAVCKRLIEVQGGRIWVAPRDGGGLEVGFLLPATNEGG